MAQSIISLDVPSSGTLNLDILLRLRQTPGKFIGHRGQEIPLERVLQHLESQLVTTTPTLNLYMPKGPGDTNPIQFILWTGPLEGSEINEGVMLDTPVLASGQFVSLLAPSVKFNPEKREDVRMFVSLAREVKEVMQADFAFGGPIALFSDPTITDPRDRAWPIQYFGRARVEEIGWETLSSAPVEEVTRDEHGGAWIWLVKNPCVVPKNIEELRLQLEKFLKLGGQAAE